ncbi:helix-turn-helix domain-containing protein [Microbacterium telephonicum]|uniref:XRE family transcriptional regulator n=1 Tax=Microbacterium telephonicum TaxID=1714841 RepID=A0A498CJ21_9MICO|nr:helix-turn-helix domain-containing protein [Microbacterium telephonicum]RLK52281.1 XRE family transcriptional regulator [Microbacterium telephonicum]
MSIEQSVAPSIGARLRQLRLAQGRSLASVAQAVGISSSALSQIETGAMQPSVNRLIEIVGEVGVPVSAIFDDYDVLHPKAAPAGSTEPIPGVRVTSSAVEAGEGATLEQGVVYRRLSPVGLDGIDLFESVYPPGASSSVDGAMLVHSGYEVGSILRGRLRFEFTEGSVDLGAGDSLAFWATRPHRVVNESTDAVASAIWLTLRDLREPVDEA